MTLTEQDYKDLARAREARRTDEFLARYREQIERSRRFHEARARRHEPTAARMAEQFDF